MSDKTLIFEWGTVPIQAPAKPTLRVVVKYSDVKGKVRIGEQISVQMFGSVQPCKIVGFELDRREEEEVNNREFLLWVEVELLRTATASEGGSIGGEG